MMPNGWTALKCEGCGNPLEPVSDVPGLLIFESPRAIEALRELSEAMTDSKSWSKLPIIAGDLKPEIVKHPLADMLRCSRCGLLYEKATIASQSTAP